MATIRKELDGQYEAHIRTHISSKDGPVYLVNTRSDKRSYKNRRLRPGRIGLSSSLSPGERSSYKNESAGQAGRVTAESA
jgi:hypothetical protein